jgi:hypothetical protein
VKIQIMGGKISVRCEGKTLLAVENKKFVDITQQCFSSKLTANNLNFQ